MTATVGTVSLFLALALPLWGAGAPLLGARTGREGFFATARGAILGQFHAVVESLLK